MADANIAITKYVLPNEGYFANLKGDTGGETYAGITKTYNPEWDGWYIVDNYVNAKGGLSQMRNNEYIPGTDVYVSDFYSNLWSKNYMDSIVNQDIANILFDWMVNSGPKIATKHVQKLVGVNQDGKMGNITVGAINASDPAQLFNAIKADREAFYNSLAASNPAYGNFLTGWLNRLSSFSFTDFVAQNPVTSGIGLGVILLVIVAFTFLSLKNT